MQWRAREKGRASGRGVRVHEASLGTLEQQKEWRSCGSAYCEFEQECGAVYPPTRTGLCPPGSVARLDCFERGVWRERIKGEPCRWQLGGSFLFFALHRCA